MPGLFIDIGKAFDAFLFNFLYCVPYPICKSALINFYVYFFILLLALQKIQSVKRTTPLSNTGSCNLTMNSSGTTTAQEHHQVIISYTTKI